MARSPWWLWVGHIQGDLEGPMDGRGFLRLQWTRDPGKEGDLGEKTEVPVQFMRDTTVGAQVY